MINYQPRFEDGQAGKYTGLNNGLGRINKYIYNLQRKWYYLVGGLSNSGKTTFVDSILQCALMDARRQGIQVDVFYYSYEIDAETKFAQWMSSYIFLKYGIEVAPEKIAGFGDNRLESHQRDLVEMEIPAMESLFNMINFRFDPTNPTGIYKELFDFYSRTGTFEDEEYTTIEKDRNDNEIEVKKRRITGYVHNNPERYVIVVVDHYGLPKLERQYGLKQNIDKLSEYFVWLRNMCGTTILALQQFNQGMHSVERKKYNGEELMPQQNDFKDSGNPYQDSDTALGIMNPHAMNSSSTRLFGYDITKIKTNFRLVNIIKNRKGRPQMVFGYYFNPKAGYFKNLPLPDMLSEADVDSINKGTYT